MFARKDFASYLDRLLARDRGEERVHVEGPSLHVDLLDQIERIKTNTPSLADEPAIERYRAAELALEEAAPRVGTAAKAWAARNSIDVADIARELAIPKGARSSQLDKLRRSFAQANHPDLAPQEMRQRAEMRMQIANMLIDKAKSQAAAGKG